MGSIRCYDAVEMIIDEATKQFSPVFKEDSEKKKKLERYCEWIGFTAEESGGEAYAIEVDDTTMDITVSLTCKEIETAAESSVFYMLLSKTKSFKIEDIDDMHIKISFVFDGIWVQA